jgi:hypothetical protein
MNERIRELVEQAGFDPAAIERMGVMPQAEKFAELIVQECAAAIVSNSKKFPPTDLTWIAAMEESARVVKAHFGVES